MSLRVRERYTTVYTGSLLNQELHPVPKKPLGNPLSNQTRLQHTIHQSSDLEPFKKHNTLTLAIHTPRVLILTTSKAHNTPLQHNTRNTEG